MSEKRSAAATVTAAASVSEGPVANTAGATSAVITAAGTASSAASARGGMRSKRETHQVAGGTREIGAEAERQDEKQRHAGIRLGTRSAARSMPAAAPA